MRVMDGNAQQRAELAGFFKTLKERGITSLSLTDYTVIEISNDFAFTRLRWELSNATGQVENTVMSTYVLRAEEAGWRAVGILEMGAPHAP